MAQGSAHFFGFGSAAGAHTAPVHHGRRVELVERGPIDVILLMTVGALVCAGLVTVYGASALEGYFQNRGTSYMFEAQAQGALAGVIAMIVAMRTDYRVLRRLAWPLMGGTFLLLAATQLPAPIGREFNGAQRWVNLGVATIQPSEILKVMTAIYMAYSIAKKGPRMRQPIDSFVAHALAFLPFIVVLMMQPDFGTSVIVCGLIAIMLFVGHARMSWMFGAVGALVSLGLWAIDSASYRSDRVAAWIDPWAHADGAGWQVVSGYVALAHGGLFGTGFGEGQARFGHVPELYNDFVAAAIGEEFGLMGMALLAVAYLVIAWRGLVISKRATDAFGAYLAVGITMLICMQAAMNLFVVTGLFPTKGLTLPFVSAGRSSLLVLMAAIGVLLNISQSNPDVASERRELRRREALDREHERIQQEIARDRARDLAERRAGGLA